MNLSASIMALSTDQLPLSEKSMCSLLCCYCCIRELTIALCCMYGQMSIYRVEFLQEYRWFAFARTKYFFALDDPLKWVESFFLSIPLSTLDICLNVFVRIYRYLIRIATF